jgi:hypothetical protein
MSISVSCASGGLFSVVSTPNEAFATLRGYVEPLIGESVAAAVSPSPKTAESLAEELQAAGFEVRSIERFRRRIVFETFEQTVDWGVKSGFFTHALAALGPDTLTQIATFAAEAKLFPFADEYVGVAILASSRG